MRQPRESFLLSGHASEFSKQVATPAFEAACEYALLQLQSEMPPNTVAGRPTDPYAAIDANAQMHGARRVLDILQTISQPVKDKPQPKRETLHYADPQHRAVPGRPAAPAAD